LKDVSLAEARKEAADLSARARKGEDIVETRRIERRMVNGVDDGLHQKGSDNHNDYHCS